MYKLLLIILLLNSIPNHSISLTYNRDKEDAVRGVLGRYFPDKVTFLNQQTIIQLKLHDVGEFCVNEMVFFSIYGDRISGVVMLFNNSGKMVSEYCSRVVGVCIYTKEVYNK